MKFSIFEKKPRKLPDPALVARGERVERLLRDEEFHAVMEELERDIWKQFMDTPADAEHGRELLYTHITALRNIKERLEQKAAQGRLAAKILKESKK